MRKISSLISVLALVLALPLSVLANINPPALPVLIYGDVTINGAAAPVGTVVAAKEGSTTLDSFTLTAAGEYSLDISADVPVGTVLKFEVNGKPVTDSANKLKMVDVAITPSVEYDLALSISTSSSSSSGSHAATPATPADPGVTPATPATPALDANGQVKDAADINVLDGDIIQCQSSADPNAVYIVKIVNGKKYIRHIVSLQIFNHYKHLKWENLIQVASLDGFSLSGWVRVNTGANGNPGAGDKVYEINGDQTRHWIDMTAAEFLLHGGSDEAIFNINAGELNLYGNGPAVRLQ